MPTRPNALSIFKDSAGTVVLPLHHEATIPTFSDVLHFMIASGQLNAARANMYAPQNTKVTVRTQPDVDLLALYMTFVHEEVVKELLPAFEVFLANPTIENMAEVIDGLFDTIWVCQGAMLATGTPIKLTWQEGAWSNLCKIDDRTGEVTKNAEGKVMKPEGWKRPDFAGILFAALGQFVWNAKELEEARRLWHTKK